MLRRILRRAAYQGKVLGFTQPFLAETADTVIDTMGDYYAELRGRRDYIKDVITAEEKQFKRTLSRGLHLLEDTLLNRLAEQGMNVLPGRDAFMLHDTYGFPLDLTQTILAERGLSVDVEGYETARREQQERSRQASLFKRGLNDTYMMELRLLPPNQGLTRLEFLEREDGGRRDKGRTWRQMGGLVLVLAGSAEPPPGQAQGPRIRTTPPPVPTHKREASASH